MDTRIQRFVREPLVHFAVVGVLLFLLFDAIGAPAASGLSLVVDARALARMLHSRNPRLDETGALDQLRALDGPSRTRLVEEYVREEVLYREALAMGLNTDGYAEKRRLVAQLEYLHQGFAYDALNVTEAQLTDYYAANPGRYVAPAQMTFTHVFFADDTHDGDATSAATQELQRLRERAVPFHAAGDRGEHFIYHRNYANRSREDISAHFGDAFAAELFSNEVTDIWLGPMGSAHGQHLVMIAARTPARQQPLEDVRGRVFDDLTGAQADTNMRTLYMEARARYQVTVIERDPEE